MKILCECQCGKQNEVRARELLDGKSKCCRSCSSKLKMQKIPYEERIARAKAASLAAAIALSKKEDAYVIKYGLNFKKLLRLGAAVKQRCINPNNLAFSNYGGRGINFSFPSVRSFAEWVIDNIGYKPTALHSLDRIDNNGNYEAGNLRWATAAEQARNKRAYKRTKNGERIKKLKELRPDLTYETIRLWVSKGVSDKEITQREKYARASV